MARYPEDFLEKIKSRTDIVELIGNYVQVQRKGRDYWACCPFHHEKTPSFQIRADQQYYRCFGCQKYGNIFSFIMEYDKVGFNEAVEILAKRAGLEVPELVFDPEAKARKELIEKIYDINRETARFYYGNIFKEEGQPAREYFAKRGLDSKIVNVFGMGYSTDFHSLPEALLKKGYDKKTLLEAGVVSQGKSGELIDFFGGRIIIPIIGGNGKVLGFTGRVLVPKPDFAKYKNTSTTLVFNKRKNLFGINLFKKFRQGDTRAMILVEGHMDVISLYQAGIQNAVASMGTSLTIEQCREIKRYADVVYVSFDGDSAGQHATLRGLDMLKNEGLDVKVVCLTDNLDPDDYVRKYGKDGYMKLLDEALPLIDYKLKKVEEGYNLDSADEKIKYAKAAIDVLSELDTVEKGVYAKAVAEKSGLKQDVIIKQTEQAGNEQKTTGVTEGTPKSVDNEPTDMLKAAEIFVVSSLIFGKPYVDIYSFAELKKCFADEKLLAVIEYFMKYIVEKNELPKAGDVFDIVEDEKLASELVDNVETINVSDQQEYYRQCVERIRNNYKNKELMRLVAELNNVTDENKKLKIREEIKNLTKAQTK
ncbi:MAG: DNA primase [Clostridiales bacterium]|nr:DNA primase [Clostridiales bacterium]MDY4655757.1 DNA primase [Eubacteriales bacterium]